MSVCVRMCLYTYVSLAQNISYHYLYHNKDWGEITTFYNVLEAQGQAILPLVMCPLGPSLGSPEPIPRCLKDGVGPGGTHLRTWFG